MKLLLLGNSQAHSLTTALPSCAGKNLDVSAHLTAGTWGPSFHLRDGKVVPNESAIALKRVVHSHKFNPEDPQWDTFDAILVSALCAYDHGIIFNSDFFRNGMLPLFGLKALDGEKYAFDSTLTTKAMQAVIWRNHLLSQEGVVLAREVRSVFHKKMYLQIAPSVLAYCKEHPRWVPNILYRDAVGAKNFFDGVRRDVFVNLAHSLNAHPLFQEPSTLDQDGFTLDMYGKDNCDGYHVNSKYGALVLSAICTDNSL
jgi:hypothetical protein